jgi:hypothetical protein
MAKGKVSKKNRRLLVLLGILVLCLVVYALVQSNQLRQINNYSYQTKINYQKTAESTDRVIISKFGHFSVVVPEGFSGVAQYTDAVLKSKDGEIIIGRNGTNFDEVNAYINDLALKNKINILKKKDLSINGLSGVRAVIEYPISKSKSKMAYFIYTDNQVYTLSTDSEALYADLDKIANSFRYLP